MLSVSTVFTTIKFDCYKIKTKTLEPKRRREVMIVKRIRIANSENVLNFFPEEHKQRHCLSDNEDDDIIYN